MTIDPPAIKPAQNDEAVRLASALVDAGAGSLLYNADGVVMRMLETRDMVLPMAVCEAGFDRASFLSPTRHYLDYPIEEIAKRSRSWNESALRLLLWPMRFIMQAGAMDRVVYPNHWLTVSRPGIELGFQDTQAMIADLVRAYPDHGIVISNVVPARSRPAYDALVSAGCDMVPSRRIWVYDPARPMSGRQFRSTRQKLNRMKRYIAESAGAASSDRAVLRGHADDMSRLFRVLNKERYSRFNPQYTGRFFRVLLDSELAEATGWFDGHGTLTCFSVSLVMNENIEASLSGYRDVSFKRGMRSIQLLSASHMERLRGRRGMLHWGGGSDAYKYHLGAMPAQEFDAVYVRHLSPRRRLPWRVLQRFRPRRGPMSLVRHKVPGTGTTLQCPG